MSNNYDASNIQVLEGLEAVRKRPGMYIGTTSSRGLHHLVWEIVDNAVDEALAGYASNVRVTINPDNSITVKDDGRGIPVEIHPKTGLSTVETIFTTLHAGGKFDGEGYKVSGGLHGVGSSVVNALSAKLIVRVFKNGEIHEMKFVNGGEVDQKLKVVGTCDAHKTGTEVTFAPDAKIFSEGTDFDRDILRTRIRELAFLNKGLKLDLEDLREGKKDSFFYEGGIKEYVGMLNKNKVPLHESIIYMSGVRSGVEVEISFQYNNGFASSLYSFVNNIKTHEGGSHEDGFKRGLTKVINTYARNKKILKDNEEALSGDDSREGLIAVVSIKHPDPQFEGQTKTKLGNSEVSKIVSGILSSEFERYLLENPEDAKLIIEKAMTAARARVAAKKARELTRRKGGLELTNQWGKLTDCSSKDASITELFIVEGDSAAGPAKQGRNSKTQAVLPIRGKILNVEKSRIDKILNNSEIRSMITAFGAGIGEEFDINKLRYNKIIIMTDADVDGAHIRTLLLTLFYRYFKPLIENGHIYAAQPPLFKISHGKTSKYVLNEKERDEYVATLPEKTRYDITRMKGLGEMDAIELRETTMHIDSRTLVKIELDDAVLADEMFTILMGEEVEPRRNFIEENALNVKNLDV